MFSEYVYDRLKYLYDSVKHPIKKENNQLKAKNNLIGSIVISKTNKNKELAIFNLMENQSIKLDALYVHLNEEDYPNKELDIEFNLQWILDYYSDIIRIEWSKDYSLFNHLKLYPKHEKDNVFMFSEDFDYDKYTIEKTLDKKQERLILNLSKDIYHKRRVYDDAIVVYENVDDSENFKLRNKDEISSNNMLTEDIFIPSYTIIDTFDIDSLKLDFDNNWECFETILAFENEYDVWNIGINHKSFKKNNNDMVLYKYLKLHPVVLEKWLKEYPGYSIFDNEDVSCATVLESNIDVGIIGFNIPEMLIDNLNHIRYKMLKLPDNIKILDVSNRPRYKLWEEHWQNFIRTDMRDKFEYLNNSDNQLFSRILPKRDEEPYGFYLYQQCVKYLIDNSKADYLFIFNSKCRMHKSVYFNDNAIMNEYGDYLKIFNLKQMREKGITFTTFEEFRIDCTAAKCTMEKMNLERQMMSLPADFDKYNSNMLTYLGYRLYFMNHWLLEHYNKELEHDYSWHN